MDGSSQRDRRAAGEQRPGWGRVVGLMVVGSLALGGCSSAAKTFGFERSPPDEFQVVKQAPLSLPPDLRLPQPSPGASRPQDVGTNNQAARELFGGSTGRVLGGRSSSGGEVALLNRAGADSALPNIRAQIDQETSALLVADRSWVDALVFWQKEREPFTVVDPAKEAQRLREATALGKPLTSGETPVIERKKRAPLEGLREGVEGIFN